MNNYEKIILLLLSCVVASVSVFAQPKGYEKSVRIGIAPDLKFSDVDVSAMFTNGYRFNPHVFLGGGAGIKVKSVGDDYVRVSRGDGYVEVYPDPTLSLALFLNAKFNLAKTRVSPYFSVDSGYVANLDGALVEQTDNSGVDSSGLFVMPSIGFDCNIGAAKKYAVFVQTGLYVQENPELLTWDLKDGPYTKVELSVGFRF
jgi:hypothetical protein